MSEGTKEQVVTVLWNGAGMSSWASFSAALEVLDMESVSAPVTLPSEKTHGHQACVVVHYQGHVLVDCRGAPDLPMTHLYAK